MKKDKRMKHQKYENWRYQVVLMNAGNNTDIVAKVINNITCNKLRTKALMNAIPVVVSRGLIEDEEIALRNTLLCAGANAFVEKVIKVY